MTIKMYGQKYELDPKLTGSAQNIIKKTLDQVKEGAAEHDVPQFYEAFVIMMYATSSAILREMDPDRIMHLIEKDDRKKTEEEKFKEKHKETKIEVETPA